MFWNLLRDFPKYTCYYEPLHDQLLFNIEEQILWQDDTHDDVKDYWREYRSIPLKRMRTFWQPWFGRERYVLTKEDEAPDLKAYLDFLIDQAEGIPVFKFVRAGLRAEWLRENYPDAQVVHIVRNPRSVWTSMMGRKCVDDSSIDTLDDRAVEWLSNMQRFAAALGIRAKAHPYEQFYELWVHMYHQVDHVADRTWWYDDAIEGSEEWMLREMIEPGFIPEFSNRTLSKRSLNPTFHTLGWYLERELNAQPTAKPQNNCCEGAYERDLMKQVQRYQDSYQKLRLDHTRLLVDFARCQEGNTRQSGRFLFFYAWKIIKHIAKHRLEHSRTLY